MTVEQHAEGSRHEAVEEAEHGRDPGDLGSMLSLQLILLPVGLEQADTAQQAVRCDDQAERPCNHRPWLPTGIKTCHLMLPGWALRS
jgi:hypothetical protein